MRATSRSDGPRHSRRVEDHDRPSHADRCRRSADRCPSRGRGFRARVPSAATGRTGAPRRRCISATPATGSRARSRTASGTPGVPRHDVAAVVHAVREVDVEASAGSPHDFVARRSPAAGGMGGAIVGPTVRFDLDDAPRGDGAAAAMHQDLAEQCARDPQGRSSVERRRQDRPASVEAAPVVGATSRQSDCATRQRRCAVPPARRRRDCGSRRGRRSRD